MPHILLYRVRLTALGQTQATRGFLMLSASAIDICQNVNHGVFDQVFFICINCQISKVYLVIGQSVVQLQGTNPTENNLHNEH